VLTRRSTLLLAALAAAPVASALDRPEVTFPVFQFPANAIPRIDGEVSDWAMVPEAYAVRTDQLVDDEGGNPRPDPKNLDVTVRVGWVKGMNRLYFLYEAHDDYWDFASPGLQNDTFEIVVDADASGGPLIDKGHREFWVPEQVGPVAAAPDDRISVPAAHWAVHGVHAQNYHVFTPAVDKDWALVWGAPTWIKELPWANAATSFAFEHGEGGRLTLELWITPFDYAGPEGPARAVESVLEEDKVLGLAWAVIDYDDPKVRPKAFWNLSRQHRMYGNASALCAFRLMPLEPALRKAIDARWSWTVVDMARRVVAFRDTSSGTITSWRWDFGDGTTSTEQHPLHTYSRAGNFVVILDVTGPGGASRRSKVWDVQLK
jgi:hypothetical protein